MKKFIPTIFILFITLFSQAQNPPKRELRGVWITTHISLDWPNRFQTPAQQQSALITILNHNKATGMNAAYFQVRSQSDAMYKSDLEPWSYYLTNKQGRAPSPFYDPMQFGIEETHKRGMEFHAWINPYRAVATAANAGDTNQYSATHVSRTHPEWLLTVGTVKILNPGLPQVREHITNVIVDMVKRYDVEGIHFDDYFYPTPTSSIADDATYNADPRGFPATTAGRADWRRDNINMLIRRVSDSINVLKPWVKFGVSPSGIYMSAANSPIGSNTSAGALQHYKDYFADTRKWIQSGWVDYLAPQIYWYIGQPGSDYKLLVPWWNNNANGRHIYIGLADYKVNDALQAINWKNPSEIPNQIRLNRTYPYVYGQIHFRHAFLNANALKYRDSVRLRLYNRPALLPTMPWKDNVAPAPATDLVLQRNPNRSVTLSWTKPAVTTNEFDKAKRFVVYRSTNKTIDLENANNILIITNTDENSYTDPAIALAPDSTYFYTVTSLDRFHNESTMSNIASNDTIKPIVITQNISRTLNTSGTVTITADDVNNGSSDNWDIKSMSVSKTIFDCSNIGENIVTLKVTDLNGNSDSATAIVTITDSLKPTVLTQNITVQLDATGNASITESQINNGSTDNCTIESYSLDKKSFNCSNVGDNTVTLTVTDLSGNVSTAPATVTVQDNIAPIVLTKNISVSLINGVATITAAQVNNGSSDACGIASMTVSPSGFTCSDIGTNTVTLTVTDIHGNTSAKTATVTVVGTVPTPQITVTRQDNTFTGLSANTVALGYGAQSLTLTASNSATTSYVWSPATGLSSINTAATIFTPSAAGTYTFKVTATNEFGCSAVSSVTITVIDVRCGNNKVIVCKKTGSNSNTSNQICISENAVPAHLQNGGVLGVCSGETNYVTTNDDEQNTASVLSVYPNPFTSQTTVTFTLPNAEKRVTLDMYDQNGTLVNKVYQGAADANRKYSFIVNTSNFRGNFFNARLTTQGKVYTFRLIKE